MGYWFWFELGSRSKERRVWRRLLEAGGHRLGCFGCDQADFRCVWTSHTSDKRFCFSVKRVDFTRLKKTRNNKTRNCVGPRVRQARLKAAPVISQDDLAGRLAAQGVFLDRSAVSRIESQERYVMDYEATALADALKVSIAWLFQRE